MVNSAPATGPTSTTPQTVLRRHLPPRVEWVEVEGEIVAWHEATESLHLLDPIAALIFQLLDGGADMESIVGELAEAFDKELDEIRGDVLRFAGSLRESDLVEVVR